MGGYCDDSWMLMKWDKNFLQEKNPSIEYLELFAVTAVVLTWITDLESRPATTPRLIARSSIMKPIFGKKLLQLENFALQQQGFLHVIQMAT